MAFASYLVEKQIFKEVDLYKFYCFNVYSLTYSYELVPVGFKILYITKSWTRIFYLAYQPFDLIPC